MNGKTKNKIRVALAVVFFALWVCLLSVPQSSRVAAREEVYVCAWENGSLSRVSYGEGYRALAGVSPAGEILLEQGGAQGKIQTSAEFLSAKDTLDTGGLNLLLGLSVSHLDGLERAALWRTYRDRLWYSEGLFRFTGEGIERVKRATGGELVLLSGGIGAGTLSSFKVRKLELRAEAELSARSLIGTGIAEISGFPPYGAADGAVYLETAGGRRLIAGLPKARSVSVHGNAYADRGALLPCAEIEALTLPFLGSGAHAADGDGGMLAWLFSDGSEYRVPASLKRLKVTGGKIAANAFYRCDALEEIELCGIDAGRISPEAFAGCQALKKLHTPCRAELGSGYAARPLGCGCIEYERE